MTRLLLFDMDDTLYNERTYVASGFRAIARHLDNKSLAAYAEAYTVLLESFIIDGRGKNIDRLLSHCKLPAAIKEELISVYRDHKPEICLNEGVASFLQVLKKDFKLCLITDGWPEVQKRKVQKMKLENIFDLILYSQSDGLQFAKPHQRYFEKALRYFQVKKSECLMIGDDLKKDMGGAKQMGIPYYKVNQILSKDEQEELLKIIYP